MLKRQYGRLWHFCFRGGVLATALYAAAAAAEVPEGCSEELLEESRTLSEASPYAIRGAYCDGTVGILHSGELQVVSYTVGDIQFQADQPLLEVVSRSTNKNPIHLVGMDKREGGSYRLDGMLGPAGLIISLAAAIHPKKIDANALGLLGWRLLDSKRVYVPVATSKLNLNEAAHLVLRTPGAIIQADYQICDVFAKCAPQRTFAKNEPAGALIPLSIPKNMKGTNYTVKITILGPANRLFGQVVPIAPPL